jgi:thiol-disulfide isomerase/thioredoxin
MRRGRHQPDGIRFLGRLSSLTALGGLAALALCACEQERKAPPAPKARNVAVHGSATAKPTTAKPVRRARQVVAKRQGKLCAGRLRSPGSAMPTSDISRAHAPGADQLPAALPLKGGKWTWVNFWAAWCVPCKEEIPRLRAWEQKLNLAGIPFRLVLVSLDDDARQLHELLQEQPRAGLRSSYWLREGKERDKWLAGVDLDPDPELPAHLLVDPHGKLRCVVEGAVEDGDYEQLVQLLRG